MNALSEIIRTLLGRPIVLWTAIALACVSYLTFAHFAGVPAQVSGPARDGLAIGAIVGAFASLAFLIVLGATHAGTAIGPHIRRLLFRRDLLERLQRLPPESRAMLYAFAMKNEREIWLLHTATGPGELRKANLVSLREIYGRACRYELDPTIHEWLQQNLGIVESWRPSGDQLSAIGESEAAASRELRNRWMAS